MTYPQERYFKWHPLLKCIPAVMLGACTSWASPPQHLMMDKDVVVSFQSSQQASASCSDLHQKIRGEKNGNIRACAFRKYADAEPVVIIPNPCEFGDLYASLLCHELAHINQMALNETVDHDGWEVIQLTKTTKTLPKLEKIPSGVNESGLSLVTYDALPDPSNILAAEFLVTENVTNVIEDVQRIKLRGLSELEPAP